MAIKEKFSIDFTSQGLTEITKNLETLSKNANASSRELGDLSKTLDIITELQDTLTSSKGGTISMKNAEKMNTLYQKLQKSLSLVIKTEKDRPTEERQTKSILEATTAIKDYKDEIQSLEHGLEAANSELEALKEKSSIKFEIEGASFKNKDNVLSAFNKNPLQLEEAATSKTNTKMKNLGIDPADYDKVRKMYEEIAIEEQRILASIETYKANILEVNKGLEEQTVILEAINETTTRDNGIIDSLEAQKEKVTENSTALNENMEQAKRNKQEVVDLTTKTHESSGSFAKAGKALLSYTVLYRTFRQVMRATLTTVKEMDAALTGMTIVTGESREKVQELIPELNSLAKATASTMTEVANLTTEYIRQGRTLQEAMTLAEETAKAAKLAGISTAESISYMTSAINGFNLAATDAAAVSDVFANLAAKSATDYESLAVALSKVSAQANTAGMSLEYTTALLAKGIEVTQEAPESIGTALKTILARMRELSDYGTVLEDNTSINNVEAALATVGISLRDTNGEFIEMEEIFNTLGPKWDQINTMQQQAIAQAVAGTRQQSRFLAIMQDWDRTLDLVNESQNSVGASAYQYSQYAQGMEAAMTNLTTSWQGFTQAITDSDTVIAVVETISSVIETFNKIADAIPGGENIATIVITLAGFFALRSKYQAFQTQQLAKSYALEAQMTESQKEMLAFQQLNATERTKELTNLREQNATLLQQKQIKENISLNELNQLKLSGQIDDVEFNQLQTLAQKNTLHRQTVIGKAENLKISGQNFFIEKKSEEQQAKALALQEQMKKEAQAELAIVKEKLATQNEFNKSGSRNKRYADNQTKAKVLTIETQGLEAMQTELSNIEKQIDQSWTKSLNNMNIEQQAQYSTITNITQIDQTKLNTLRKEELISQEMYEQIQYQQTLKVRTTEVSNATANAAVQTKSLKGGMQNAGTAAKGLATSIKGMVTSMIPMLVITAAVAAAMKLWEIATISVDDKTEELLEHTNALYEIQQEQSSLQDLLDEYSQLDRIINKTADDLERLTEIEKELSEGSENYSITGSGWSEISKNAAEVMAQQQTDLTTGINDAFVTAVEAANISIEDTFNDVNFKNAFKEKYKMSISLDIENLEQLQSAQSIAGNVIDNIDLQKVFEQSGTAIGTRFESTMKGIVTGLAVDAGSLFLTGGFGTIIGGITGFFNYDNLVKESAANLQKIITETSSQISDFAEIMSESYDDNLFDQYQSYIDAINNLDLNEFALEAIKETYGSFKLLLDAGVDPQQIKNIQSNLNGIDTDLEIELTISDSSMMGFIDELSVFGGDAAASLLDAWEDMIGRGFSTEQIMQELVFALDGSTSNAFSKILDNAYAELLQEYNGMTSSDVSSQITSHNTLQNDDAYLKLLKSQNTTWEEESLRLLNLKNEIEAVEAAYENTRNAALDMISTIGSNLDFGDYAVAMESRISSLSDIADTLLSGEALSIEQLQTLANDYSDIMSDPDFLDAMSSGNFELAAGMLTTGGGSMADLISEREKEMQAAITRQETELATTTKKLEGLQEDLTKAISEGDEDAVSSLEDLIEAEEATIVSINASINMMEIYIATVDKMTDSQIAAAQSAQDLANAERDIANGLTSGYTNKIELLQQAISDAERQIESYAALSDNDAMYSDMLMAFVKGEENLADQMALLSDSEQQEYTLFIESYKDYYDEFIDMTQELADFYQEYIDYRIDLINELTDVENARLEEQRDALIESLDERAELYQKYFDLINQEAETEDYEGDRENLVNRIAQLAGATDSKSLALLAEAQSSLADLDDEYNATQREARQQALLDRIERQQEAIQEAYDAEMLETAQNMEAFLETIAENTSEENSAFVDNILNAVDTSGMSSTEAAKTIAEMASLLAAQGLDVSGTGAEAAKTTITENTGMTDSEFYDVYRYKKGGVVDYTGPAWVDGTKSDPEAFLNATQTRMIGDLATSLQKGNLAGITGDGILTEANASDGNLTINGMNIEITGNMGSQAEALETGKTLVDAFYEGIKRQGLNINTKRR